MSKTYTQQEVDNIKWNYENVIKDLTESKGADYIANLKGIIKNLESRCDRLNDDVSRVEANAEAQKLIVRELRSIILESMSHD